MTDTEVRLLNARLTRLYPVDERPCFDELLNAIDKADREMVRLVED